MKLNHKNSKYFAALSLIVLSVPAAAQTIEEYSIDTVNPAEAHRYGTGVAGQINRDTEETRFILIDQENTLEVNTTGFSVIGSYEINPRFFTGLRVDSLQIELEGVDEDNRASIISPYAGVNLNDNLVVAYRVGFLMQEVDITSADGRETTNDESFINHNLGLLYHDQKNRFGFAFELEDEDLEREAKRYVVHGRRAISEGLGLGANFTYLDTQTSKNMLARVTGDMVIAPNILLEGSLGYIQNSPENDEVDDSNGYIAQTGIRVGLNEALDLGANAAYSNAEAGDLVSQEMTQFALTAGYKF